MTTARRAKTCGSCGFALDHMIHMRNCVPTSQWPRGLRDRKAAAMGHAVPDDLEREPEREKPQGLAEYRRLHPEANPLTNEHMTVREFRKREDGGVDEWERTVGVREAMNKAQACPRCQRPLLDPSMHITCQPLNGDRIPVPVPRLVRDDVPLTPRHPVIHTTADVRTGANWYEALSEAEEPAVDEDEMRDFLGAPEPDVPENVDTTLRDRLAAGQASYVPVKTFVEQLEQAGGDVALAPGLYSMPVVEIEPFTCPSCGRVSKSAAGNAAHQRSHARKA